MKMSFFLRERHKNTYTAQSCIKIKIKKLQKKNACAFDARDGAHVIRNEIQVPICKIRKKIRQQKPKKNAKRWHAKQHYWLCL